MMPNPITIEHRDQLKSIRTFPSLVKYLRDELDWPITSEDFEELTFDYTPEELGIDLKNAAKIQEIKRLRPLASNQPWGIFFVKFEPKQLPVVALRRILSQIVVKKRSSANSAERKAWQADDLLFVSNYGGEGEERRITFAHFSQDSQKKDLPTLKVLGWDNLDTPLHLDHVADVLSERLTWPKDEKNIVAWQENWRAAFTLGHREVITTSKDLAVKLAKLARDIRDRIKTVLAIETENGPVTRLMTAFKEALVHDLDKETFADMYAQTIAYGLLSARVENPSGGTADHFAGQMPATNPFLKELMETFLHVGGRNGKTPNGRGIDFDELGVSEVVELLDDANMEAVVLDFGDKNPQEDPVIHFYELFLKEYDAKKRMQRGVFYTPRPVVSFIVRSVDELLRTDFGLEDGLADTATWGDVAARHKDLKIPEGISSNHGFVQILDPATGTGTFLVEVIDRIYKTMTKKWKVQGEGAKKINQLWNEYVPKHLLPRLHGFELLMAPYAIAHMKIGLKLYETGYRFMSDERARIYLTNAIEPAQDFSGKFDFMIPALAHEAEAVNAIKRDQRFTVVIGNPPYANRGMMNRNDWILALLDEYKKELNEKKLNLDDDFIKFIRYGQYLLMSSRYGIISLISSNTFLDGVTHRRMRESILECFQSVRILDLHGNSQRGEASPDGSADENVFDIRQGVAITTLARSIEGDSTGDMFHHQLWGTRDSKYKALMTLNPKSMSWSRFKPAATNFFFVPGSLDKTSEYEQFVKVNEIFVDGNNGFVTDRDELFFDFDSSPLAMRMQQLFGGKLATDFVQRYRVVASSSYNILKRISGESFERKNILRCLYRPFDIRSVYYSPSITSRPGYDVMRHMGGGNIGLVLARLIVRSGAFDACLVSRHITEKKCGDSTRSSYLFPLYRRDSTGTKSEGLFGEQRRVNLNGRFIDKVKKKFELSFVEEGHGDLITTLGPEDILGYVYSILHSPLYRERYGEWLKIDFPRLPLTENLELFRALSKLGRELVAFHLMESLKLANYITSLIGSGEARVEKVSYSDETVWIDKAKTRGFKGVPDAVWNFHIGGYQVCEKWLKDRGPKKGQPGRILTDEDLNHYQKIVVALNETILLMKEIDEVIDQHGGWPDAFTSNKR